ncbi:MAG: PQQ-binding-like beta-propeller repeat protein [Alphaproteobacteria bacterium]|nr:PQQ-binding-like beta-propeller repeat protein [Alphaproteobacteria bacterium]MDP6517754.1 PQQ-binding-like beta-propeller repeat protein [Alphaproteobacteria bacterium]
MADDRAILRAVLAGVLGLALTGCDTVKDLLDTETEAPPLPGERISVLALEQELEPDPEIASEPVRLPRPVVNRSWPQQGGVASHAMHHLAAGESLALIWRRGVGAGETDDNLILSSPVVADFKAFLLDADSVVTAFNLASGATEWRADLLPENEESEASLGGGVAYAQGRVFAATAFGYLVALDAKTGARVWMRRIGAPLRAAPTVSDGRVFVITFDNRLFAIDADDGTELWSHTGITETAGLLGSAVPAVSGDLVLASYSSGEIFALRVENGRVAWSDSLIFQGRIGATTTLSDIDANPVIDRGQVFAISHSGRLVAIDLRSGLRLWDQEIAGAQTPWLAGDYLFLVTLDSHVVCLRRVDGRVRWVTPLTRFEDPEDREGAIVWSGPVLVGDRLVVVNSLGEALAISPYTGRWLGKQDLPDGARVAPVVANETLYILTVDGDLVALR